MVLTLVSPSALQPLLNFSPFKHISKHVQFGDFYAEAGLLNKGSCLARALGATKFDLGQTLLCYLSTTFCMVFVSLFFLRFIELIEVLTTKWNYFCIVGTDQAITL